MRIPIRKTFVLLSSIAAVLVILGWATQYYASIYKPLEFQIKDCHGFIRMFYLDGEANVPAWFQSMMLVSCAFLLALVCKNRNEASHCFHWRAMSVVFLGLSLDEVACLHEGISSQLYTMFHTSGLFLYAWVIPGALFAMSFFLWSLPFLRHLPRTTRRRFMVAGSLYILGTIGWEMVGGWYVTHYGMRNLTLMTLNAIEETFEVVGILLFLRAVMLYLCEEQKAHSEVQKSPKSTVIPSPWYITFAQ